MKDWKRSPEPASMMGSQSSYFDTDPPGDLSCTSTISLAAATTTTTSSSSSIMSIARTSTHLQQIEDVPSSPRSRTKVDTSLSDMAKRVILQKIHMFDTFGDTPFPIIRSILEQIPAKKLRALEEASPVSKIDSIWPTLLFYYICGSSLFPFLCVYISIRNCKLVPATFGSDSV